MATPENLVVISPSLPVSTPQEVGNGYAAVRLNAMKHGILSSLAVLPHEDEATFAELLAALIEEHRPMGMTELHLVEELAAVIWRKRRVLMAEGARINSGLRNAVESPKMLLASAAPFERGLANDEADLPDILTSTAEQTAQQQREAEMDHARTRKAAAILHKGAANAYEKARRALRPDSREWWDEFVEEGEFPASAEGLAQFIQERLEPFCWRMVQEARFTPAIRAQTLGEGLQVNRLEKLNRYETHLDRKFERTLAMLLKLKDLRSA